ncbi:MAG: serine/threonine protein kinase [Planctomycetes bacterium]|nr:serine/threonine protein kinase [Planctomycetota bacterium]
MEFKVENLCGFLIRSKLMTPEEMQAMRQRWLAEAKDAAQAHAFLKWLVANDYVTAYQASLLSRGHVDDFFLGDYKIQERIGRGRMAGVYKAAHSSGQTVAIKVLPPSKAKIGQTLARFQREARLSIKLKHPHVVRSFQVGETKGVHYLVMEYLEGETLEELLQRRKRLPPAEAVRLVHQALLGLQHIHEMGMVHRDLKPANLMLQPAPARGEKETTLKSNIKILDIGLAREFFDENEQPEGKERAELTGEGVLLGTPDYLAPEQARDPRCIDIRADIYSLGCTLYHCLTGQPPFPDKNILNQMIRHATETAKPLQDFVPTLPKELSQIVEWMMAKQPDKRYATPARAAQALDMFLMVTGEPVKTPEETPQMKKYLTWLEVEDKESEGEKTLPPPATPTAPPAKQPGKPPSNPSVPVASPTKPASNPNVPVASPVKPPSGQNIPVAAPARPAAPEKKRKRRTGVKPPPAPEPAPLPVAAHAAPLDSTVSAPAATSAPAGDEIDVELVEMPAPAAPEVPAPKGLHLTWRDAAMVGVGVAVTLVLLGIGWLAIVIARWFSDA